MMAKGSRTQVWPGMTEWQLDGIGCYLRELADSIMLGDWTLRILHTPVPDDDDKNALARVMCLPGQFCAEVQLAEDFNLRPLEVKRHCLIHELCHCHMRGMQRIVYELDKTVGRVVWDVLYMAWDEQHELATDNFSRIIARLIDDSSITHYLER